MTKFDDIINEIYDDYYTDYHDYIEYQDNCLAQDMLDVVAKAEDGSVSIQDVMNADNPFSGPEKSKNQNIYDGLSALKDPTVVVLSDDELIELNSTPQGNVSVVDDPFKANPSKDGISKIEKTIKEGSNTVRFIGNIHVYEHHWVKKELKFSSTYKSVVCVGDKCELCENGDRKRNAYVSNVIENGIIKIMRLGSMILGKIKDIADEKEIDPGHFSGYEFIIKYYKNRSNSNRYEVALGSKNDFTIQGRDKVIKHGLYDLELFINHGIISTVDASYVFKDCPDRYYGIEI